MNKKSSKTAAQHQKQMQYSKYNDRYAAPIYHYNGPDMALLPKPGFIVSADVEHAKDLDTPKVKAKSYRAKNHQVCSSHQPKTFAKASLEHTKTASNSDRSHTVLPKTGKKKAPKFIPKAILKKPESSSAQICPSPSHEPKTETSLLQLLAKKNTKAIPSQPALSSNSIEEQLSGKICALLGIIPSSPTC
jgi:hypothetical protein